LAGILSALVAGTEVGIAAAAAVAVVAVVEAAVLNLGSPSGKGGRPVVEALVT
jgi:hypothetical protein